MRIVVIKFFLDGADSIFRSCFSRPDGVTYTQDGVPIGFQQLVGSGLIQQTIERGRGPEHASITI